MQKRILLAVDDSLHTTHALNYDAIVDGRRGASQLRRWLLDSVTSSLIEHSKRRTAIDRAVP
jgi:nucleotide-binding universal stress UspA family protein